MATMQVLGYSSGEGKIKFINHTNFVEAETSLRNWMRLQPASLEPFYTEDDVIVEIAKGNLFAWLVEADGYEIGIVLFSAQIYPKASALKVEFVSCQNFLSIAKLYPLLEIAAKEHGFDYIEAIAHPTIAGYGWKKMGFSAPSVYVRKAVQNLRRQ